MTKKNSAIRRTAGMIILISGILLWLIVLNFVSFEQLFLSEAGGFTAITVLCLAMVGTGIYMFRSGRRDTSDIMVRAEKNTPVRITLAVIFMLLGAFLVLAGLMAFVGMNDKAAGRAAPEDFTQIMTISGTFLLLTGATLLWLGFRFTRPGKVRKRIELLGEEF
ncbi:hypothetical protein ECE50_027375 [Chitinophaga sp. Mgbs1]|uniref:Uncharacterized protein n=1 Tax=Chitinophaga solisilvae TaxID=1233460 RepID=A0A9Q5GV02_9BACT|nr:hypothetical protein [Chitinophaga solisilvae]